MSWPLGCKDAGEMVQRGISIELLKTEDAIEYFIRLHCGKEWKETASPVQKAEMQDTVAGMIAAVGKDNARDIYINSMSGNLEINPRRLEELVKKFRSQKETEESNTRAKEFTYIKVLDDYLERQVKPDNSDGMTVVYVSRKVAELRMEKGLSFVRDIPRFHNWITNPSHTNYLRIIEHQYEGQVFDSSTGTSHYPTNQRNFPFQPDLSAIRKSSIMNKYRKYGIRPGFSNTFLASQNTEISFLPSGGIGSAYAI